MAPKTTSGSGFHFIFRFSVVDLVDNATNLENHLLHFFEKFDLKVEEFKKYLNELREFPMEKYRCISVIARCCGGLRCCEADCADAAAATVRYSSCQTAASWSATSPFVETTSPVSDSVSCTAKLLETRELGRRNVETGSVI